MIAGAVVSAPFIAPKVRHFLPGPEENHPDKTEIVEANPLEEDSESPTENREEPIESEEQVTSDTFLEEATVQRVIDGDTIIADTEDIKDMRIRFIGIDTPESVHPDEWKNTEEGIIASDFTKGLLSEGKIIYLEQDISNTDPYDRYLRYIWLTDNIPADVNAEFIGEYMVNGILLKEGQAKVTIYPPDTKYKDTFKQLEQW